MINFADITWANPEYFWIGLIIPILIAYYIFAQRHKNAEIQVSSTAMFGPKQRTWKHYMRHSMFVLRILAVIFIIVALARPQSSSSREDVNVEGIDIVTALDISGSMLAEDFKPNRLEAAKNVLSDFVAGRENDRIGVVVFAGESFTQCPLTTDHSIIENLIQDLKYGLIEDGTAIGDGLATAVNRLKESDAVSKVIILLTDGVNNSGYIDPRSAADIAVTYGIRVYTIGVGAIGTAPIPYDTPFGRRYQNMEVQIDEDLLREISNLTDAKYFRATNNKALEDIYKEIDDMEKTKINVTEFHKKHEEFLPFAVAALLALALEFLLRYTIFKRLP